MRARREDGTPQNAQEQHANEAGTEQDRACRKWRSAGAGRLVGGLERGGCALGVHRPPRCLDGDRQRSPAPRTARTAVGHPARLRGFLHCRPGHEEPLNRGAQVSRAAFKLGGSGAQVLREWRSDQVGAALRSGGSGAQVGWERRSGRVGAALGSGGSGARLGWERRSDRASAALGSGGSGARVGRGRRSDQAGAALRSSGSGARIRRERRSDQAGAALRSPGGALGSPEPACRPPFRLTSPGARVAQRRRRCDLALWRSCGD